MMSSCLLEAQTNRKNKISLTDYNYLKDIENRLLMADFTSDDLEVLEEILYSSIRIPLPKLSKNLNKDLEDLLPILQKLSKTGLFVMESDSITVDKEMRKYFEFQIQKFDEDFQPGMEYLQGLLKKVPIHVLPVWYSIPRTSDNIFDSLVERHLLTPQIFQRYILELNLGEPVLKDIIQDVYTAENFEISSKTLMQKYNFTRELFEEYMLHLEFSFVCCLGYRKIGNQWEETVTPFHEWKEYLQFLKETETPSIENSEDVIPKRPAESSFVQDLAILVEMAKQKPLLIETQEDGLLLPIKEILSSLLPRFTALSQDPNVYRPYISHLIQKLLLVRLCEISNQKLTPTEMTDDWLSMRLDNQSLYLYRHPKNRILSVDIAPELWTEKALRESEKSIVRVLHKNWVFFDDFLKGVVSPLNEDLVIMLKRFGKNWKYTTPQYSNTEKVFLKAIVFEWLFEAGLVQVGTLHGKDCFRVTTLGQTLFAR